MKGLVDNCENPGHLMITVAASESTEQPEVEQIEPREPRKQNKQKIPGFKGVPSHWGLEKL